MSKHHFNDHDMDIIYKAKEILDEASADLDDIFHERGDLSERFKIFFKRLHKYAANHHPKLRKIRGKVSHRFRSNHMV